MKRLVRPVALGSGFAVLVANGVVADPIANVPSSVQVAQATPAPPPPPPSGPTVSSQETTAFRAPVVEDPYLQPKGVPLGGPFRLFPTLSTRAVYSDYVLTCPTAQNSDIFFTISPSLVFEYNTSRARLDLYANADIHRYSKLTQIDNEEYAFGLTGNYEIAQEVRTNGGAGYSINSESLSSPNVVSFQQSPTQYRDLNVHDALVYKPNRLGFKLSLSYDDFNFYNTPLIGGGTLGNKDRDNKLFKATAETSYDFSPGYSAFLRETYNSNTYDRFLDRSGIHRSSDGYESDLGVSLLLGDLIKGEIYAGYIQQNYDQNQAIPLRDIGGVDFGANLTWYPTNLITVQLGASRTFVATTLAGASAGDDKNVNLSTSWSLTREITLQASSAFDDLEYKGTSPFRHDQTMRFGGGGKWALTHYVSANLDYDYINRTSTSVAAKYDENLVTFRLDFQI